MNCLGKGTTRGERGWAGSNRRRRISDNKGPREPPIRPVSRRDAERELPRNKEGSRSRRTRNEGSNLPEGQAGTLVPKREREIAVLLLWSKPGSEEPQ